MGSPDKHSAIVADGEQIVFRDAELVASLGLAPPASMNASDDPQPPCTGCGKALDPVFITTGGPLGDPLVWRDHPIAVDGWACLPCGQFRYPRKMSPAEITELVETGVQHGRAGRFVDAELCFVRAVWDWPGYPAAHLNYAEATRSRLHHSKHEDAPVLRKLEARMLAQYEAGVKGFRELPTRDAAPMVTRALLALSEHALFNDAPERARHFAKQVLGIEGAPPADLDRAREIAAYIDLRLDLFHRAGEVLGPYLELMDVEAKPIGSDDRNRIADAISDLELHLQHAPNRWQSAWLYSKALFAAGRSDDAFAAWQRAHETFADSIEIARDYSNDLLRANRTADALAVNAAITARHPQSASLHCNLAVTQMLVGAIDAAKASVATARRLDPEDAIAKTVEKRLARGAPYPTTLGELERGG